MYRKSQEIDLFAFVITNSTCFINTVTASNLLIACRTLQTSRRSSLFNVDQITTLQPLPTTTELPSTLNIRNFCVPGSLEFRMLYCIGSSNFDDGCRDNGIFNTYIKYARRCLHALFDTIPYVLTLISLR